MKFIKKNLYTIILVLIFIIGLSLLLYPSISDYWNSFHQTRAIAKYCDTVENLDEKEYDMLLEKARAYNQKLIHNNDRWYMSKQDKDEYNSLLDVTDTGIMGYIEIPSIQTSLPIYHGTDEGVLQIAVGHLPGSSLPVGGNGTHTVISAHRGLPSAKLFTDIDQLDKGDIFVIHVLNDVYSYEVDQIRIVEPDDLSDLNIEEDNDYCTLLTCTPYGINSHRLLVRGHRIENMDGAQVSFDAQQIDSHLIAVIIAAFILIVIFVLALIYNHRRKKRRGYNEE